MFYWVLWEILFPFDCGGGFGADVVNDTVYAFDGIDYFVWDGRKKHFFELVEIGCHTVGWCYGTETDDILVAAFIAHDAYSLNRKEFPKCEEKRLEEVRRRESE